MTDDIEGILYGSTPENNRMVEAKTRLTQSISVKEPSGKLDEKIQEKTIEKKLVKGPTAYISIKYSSTIPLGDFRMCRVEKSLFIPVGIEEHPAIQEKIQNTHDWGCTFLEKLMEKEVTEALQAKTKAQNVTKEEDVFGSSL